MAKKDWNPKKTKVLTLGLGLADWNDPEDPIGDRDKVLHKFFKKCGVPDQHNIHIRDEGGDRDSLLEFLPDFLADSDEDFLFIFYYAGHGGLVEESEESDLYFCHPELDSLTLTNLIEQIESYFEGWNVLLMADCCYSGNIARFAANSSSDYNYAGLSSALDSKTSTGAWTFTDCVLAALNGKNHIDSDESGEISLQELADYVKEQMKKIENQKSDFGFSESFDAEMCLAVAK